MERYRHLFLGLVVFLIYDFIIAVNKNPEVITKLGRIRGSIMYTRLGKPIYTFRGVYYAEPPVGNLRFKLPVPKKPWNGVMDASKEGPSCPQDKGVLQSENCLVLNIYTKEIQTTGSKSPVIVSIHPGAYREYSSQSFLFGPYYLLDEDVVLVTINHRLGSFGFLNTGDEFAPGNFGFKDQVEALRFVQKHIESFGGDPNSVLLEGQSSGARSITLHLVSSMSKGLFHRAIALSGSSITLIPPQREQMSVAVRQAELLGCPTRNKKEMYKCLLEKPAEDYAATTAALSQWQECPELTWYPAIENEIPGVERFLTDDPVKLIKKGPVNAVPLIMGVTKDEYSNDITDVIKAALNGNDSALQEFNDRWYELAPLCFMYESGTVRSKFISDELKMFYFNNSPISLENYDQLRHLFGNAIGHFPYYRTAKLLAKFSSEPVYFYEFSYFSNKVKNDWKKFTGEVAHGEDMQFLFSIMNKVYPDLSEAPLYNEHDPEIFMVKRLTKLWAHFAKTGEPLPRDPELFGNVTWDRLTPETKKYLNIDKELVMKTDFMRGIMDFWEHLFL